MHCFSSNNEQLGLCKSLLIVSKRNMSKILSSSETADGMETEWMFVFLFHLQYIHLLGSFFCFLQGGGHV